MINLHVAYQANLPNDAGHYFADCTIERWPYFPRNIVELYALKDHLLARPENVKRHINVVIIIAIIPLGSEYVDE